MTFPLPDPLRDHVQDRIASGRYRSADDTIGDVIRRDQAAITDEDGWLRALDASLVDTLAEKDAGGGIDLDAACDAVSATLRREAAPPAR